MSRDFGPGQLIVEEDDERCDQSIVMTPDGQADRALRAAVFGVILPPFLQLYSLMLLLNLSELPGKVSPSHKWKVRLALAIDLIVAVPAIGLCLVYIIARLMGE
jgi:hypothetical protein